MAGIGSRPRRRRLGLSIRRRLGLTILELACACALLAVVLVSVLVVLNQLMAATAKGADTAAGLIFAGRVLDRTTALQTTTYATYFADTLATGTPVTYSGAESLQSHATNITQNFAYNLTITPLTDSKGAGSQNGRSFLMHVDVWWWVTAPNQARQGLGKLTVSLQRMLYRRDPSVAPGQ